MLTKGMWEIYVKSDLEFCPMDLIGGNLLILITPLTLLFDLIFIIPEILIYRKR